MRPQTLKCLVKRGDIYYFRLAIPTKLRHRFGCIELKASLKTDDRWLARRRCRYLSHVFEELFISLALMPEITQDQLQNIARSYFRSLLIEGNDLIFKIENDLFSHSDNRAAERDEWLEHAKEREERLRELDHTGEATDIFMNAAKTLLQEHGVKDNGDSRDVMSQYIVRAQIEQHRIFQAKLRKRYQDVAPVDPLFANILDDSLPPMAELGQTVTKDQRTIGELIEKFKASREKTWIYKTRLDFERMLGCFAEWFGSQRQVQTITTVDMGEYRDVLVRLPKRFQSKGKDKVALKDLLSNPPQGETIKPQSAEKYLNLTRSFLNWCVDEGYLDKVPGKKITIEYTVDEKPRLPFESDQLTALFASPVWSGCYSKSRRSRPGTLIFQNAYFWIPLIGVYTGMRCGEIVQLRYKDIRTFDGIPYIDVNDDNQKKLKTKYSNRRIPLHPRLKEWGFLEFLQGRASASADDRIFKEVSISKQGDPSHAYSKAFSRYLIDIGLKNKHLSFHSFRHTFSDACDNASVTEPQRKAMMGHSDQSASSHYGTGASIPVLLEAISRIEYAFEATFDPSPASCTIISKG